MTLNSHALFANLAERERVHGHHSPEGQAIRMLSRALDGWSSGNLAGADVVTLCGQAVEDWLKLRLKVSPWSTKSLSDLLALAAAENLLSSSEAEHLQLLLSYRNPSDIRTPTAAEIDLVLQTAIDIVGHYWS